VNPDQRKQLVVLFQETGPAHHQAYIQTDGADPEWPLWYAEHMQENLNGLLKTSFTRSKIVQLLVSASEEQEARAPGADWTAYFADYFLSHISQAG
jgi:hypothetical protein